MKINKIKHRLNQGKPVNFFKEESPLKENWVTETYVLIQKNQDEKYEVLVEKSSFDPLIDITEFDEVHEKTTQVFDTAEEALEFAQQKIGPLL